MLKRFAAAGALALGAVLSAAGVAHADDVVVRDANGIPRSWPSEASCIKDGPDQHLQNVDDDAFLKPRSTDELPV
ncbi:hypothetical protein [Mycobacterium sp. 48b]|uniref:hypothetical protein n=1 Tax=Mycobacterium sp. 48b TaxID=3400426 RepID=UPI003AAE353E